MAESAQMDKKLVKKPYMGKIRHNRHITQYLYFLVQIVKMGKMRKWEIIMHNVLSYVIDILLHFAYYMLRNLRHTHYLHSPPTLFCPDGC